MSESACPYVIDRQEAVHAQYYGTVNYSIVDCYSAVTLGTLSETSME